MAVKDVVYEHAARQITAAQTGETAPSGEPLFLASNLANGCTRDARYFVVRDAAAVTVASFADPRESPDDGCGERLRVDRVGEETLDAIRTFVRPSEQQPWRLRSELVWRGGAYVPR